MNIAFVSSSRSDFGLIRPILKHMLAQRGVRVELVLIGAIAHVSKRELTEGLSRCNVHALKGRFRDNHLKSQAQMMIEFSNLSQKFSTWLNTRSRALDFVFVPGDRFEIFAAAIAAYYNNIPVAHLFGGDRSAGGHLDDSVRHSITKLAHVHFAVCSDSYRRILNLGEEKWRVHNVGSPVVESARELIGREPFTLSDLITPRRYNILCGYNPITTESKSAGRQFDAILTAFQLVQKKMDVAFIFTHPNNEFGSRDIISRLQKLKHGDGTFVFKNLGWKKYLQTLSECDLLVGNSSSGLLEAPIVGTPTLNVGTRQEGRFSPRSVQHERTYNAGRIAAKMERMLVARPSRVAHPYGDGHTSKKILTILSRLTHEKSRIQILQKQISY